MNNTTFVQFIRKAAAYGADVFRRGQMTIGWRFDARRLSFKVVVRIGDTVQLMARLSCERFYKMFASASHWIGVS